MNYDPNKSLNAGLRAGVYLELVSFCWASLDLTRLRR